MDCVERKSRPGESAQGPSLTKSRVPTDRACGRPPRDVWLKTRTGPLLSALTWVGGHRSTAPTPFGGVPVQGRRHHNSFICSTNIYRGVSRQCPRCVGQPARRGQWLTVSPWGTCPLYRCIPVPRCCPVSRGRGNTKQWRMKGERKTPWRQSGA